MHLAESSAWGKISLKLLRLGARLRFCNRLKQPTKQRGSPIFWLKKSAVGSSIVNLYGSSLFSVGSRVNLYSNSY